MGHHGYIPVMYEHLTRCSAPKVLEIGVDRGQTLIPILFFLTHNKKEFHVTSVDIRLDPSLEVMLQYTGLLNSQYMTFCVENSLTLLQKMETAPEKTMFDLIILDGDHNYHTVSQELKTLKTMMHPGTLMIVDDYSGKWSENDLFYSDRESHANIDLATKRVQTDKHGVKTAVDEFLAENPHLAMAAPLAGEPVMIYMAPEQKEKTL